MFTKFLRQSVAPVVSVSTAITLLGVCVPAQAFSISFDGDQGGNLLVADAEAKFLSNFIGVGTENFESFSAGATLPLNLNFPGGGTASLTGSRGIQGNFRKLQAQKA